MEMLMIGEEKLKITLSAEDLEEFGLCPDELDYGNTDTKRMFWDLLGRAKHTLGFDTDGHRVLVQLYTCRKGGCEIFVTRLGEVCRSCGDDCEASDNPVLHYKPSHKIPDGTDLKVGAFCFERIEWLIDACRRLADIGYDGNSEAYISDDGRYFLFLDGLDATGYLPLDEFSFICEYGTAENVSCAKDFLVEHGRILCPSQAVATLGALQ